jgi:group I intron endonuclease
MKNKNRGIYIIVNQVNGKLYIGQSRNIKLRWENHLTLLRNNRHGITKTNKKTDHLQSSFNKHGEDAFIWKILENCKEEKLKEREIYYIYHYQSFNPLCGYNKTLGGEGHKISDEIKEKLSKANTGKKRTPEQNERNRLIHLGKKLLIESVKKRSQTNMKYKHLEKEWRELKNQGLSYMKIAKIYNISDRTIWSYLNKYIPEKKIIHVKRKFDYLVEDWRRLFKEGISYREIGRKYNTNHMTIRYYLVNLYPEKIEEELCQK